MISKTLGYWGLVILSLSSVTAIALLLGLTTFGSFVSSTEFLLSYFRI